MKIINLFVLLFLVSIPVIGQQTALTGWGKQYGFAEDAFRVAADDLGNCFIGGTSSDSLSTFFAGKHDAFIRKFDDQGNIQWTVNIGTDKDDYCYSICSDALGNCYLAGKTAGNLGAVCLGGYDAFIAKVNPAGNILWIKQFGTDKADDLAYITLDKSGNCCAAGSTLGNFNGTLAGATDAIFVKFSQDGNLIWKKQYGTISGETGEYICFDKNNTCYAKLSSKAILQFQDTGNISVKFIYTIYLAKGIAVDDSLNIYIGGTTGVENGSQAILIKYNKELVKQWERRFGSGPWTGINDLIKFQDGTDDILVGVCQAWPGCSAVARRYDTHGNTKWIYNLKNKVNSVCGHWVTIGKSDSYYITGITDGNLFATKIKSQEYFLSKIIVSGQTGIKNNINQPLKLELNQNFPNPFNPSTRIFYSIPEDSPIRINIFSIDGKLVKTLLDIYQISGNYSICWDGKDEKGLTVSSGIYIYKLEANRQMVQKKMVLLR